MREILFKGKSKYTNNWIYGYLVKLGKESFSDPDRYGITDKGIPIGSMDVCYNFHVDEVVPDTIGQYTGVKDENNIRIFENDIISIPYTDMFGFTEYQQALVFWHNEILDWCVRFMDGEVLYLNDVIDSSNPMDISVVDNIIDNKELAKVWE